MASPILNCDEELSPAVAIDRIVSPLAEIQRNNNTAQGNPTTESLCWPSCGHCGYCLDPEIPPCFCPYCSGFNC